MATCNAYPKFEANQVLTAEQLNRVVAYLKGQDLLTRRKLIGIGPYCGLAVSHTIGIAPKIQLSSGCGITSEGDLVELSSSDTTRYRNYVDPVGYSLFRNGAGQVNLWELRTAAETTADDGSQPLTQPFLQDKIILLYLECREIDLKTCTGDDCDEEGIRVEACVRKLAVDMADADTIIQNARKNVKSGNTAFLAKYKLPQLRIGRSSDLLKLGARITSDNLAKYYQGLMEPVLDDLSQAYQRSYETYVELLDSDFNQNPFEAKRLRQTLDQIIRTHPRHFQYVYDFLKDLIDAYDEFRLTAFDFGTECCPDSAHFPKHLMLGPVIAEDSCTPSAYRQHFIPAPLFNRQGQLRGRCRLLFKKMAMLVNNFTVPAYQPDRIRITPSAGVSHPLSRRAIPYYYSGPEKLHQSWNFDLNRICKSDHQLSYHAGSYAPKKLAFIHDPLSFEWDDFSFLRVEGHIGGKYADVSSQIESLIRRYNLPIQLVGLKLDKKIGYILPDIRVFENFTSRLNLAADVLGLKREDVDVLLDSDRLVSKMGLSATIKPELVKSIKSAGIISPTKFTTPFIQPIGSFSSIGIAQPVGPIFQPPSITTPQPGKEPDTDIPACRYQDLEALYAALRSELICLLEKETQFFGNLKFDDKKTTTQTGEDTGVKGGIFDLKGQPLPNADITILDSRFNKAVARGTTAADGTFDFKNLEPGKYYVDVKYGDLEISKDLVDIQDKQTLGIDYRFEAQIPKETATIRPAVGGITKTAPTAPSGLKMAAAVEKPIEIKSAAQPSAIKSGLSPEVSKVSIPLSAATAPIAPAGFRLAGAPITTYHVSKATVLDKGLRQPTTINTIGEFYKEFDKAVTQEDKLDFSYDFFSKYPFADRAKVPEVFAQQINAPLKMLDSFDQLDRNLPDALVAFDYSVFAKSYQAMVTATEEYRSQVFKDLSDPNLQLKGNENEILIHLDRLLAACSLDKFETLYEIYTERKTRLNNLIRFAVFIQEHTGIEHLAGVPKGGTLIIVYDTSDIVVADFCLPYICCSECPPVSVGAPIPVVFKLPRTEFCKSDPNQYKVITNVPGEPVKGPGIEVDQTTGDSYFNPAADDVPLGTVRWSYVVQHRTYTFEARIIEADATFNHEVTVDEIDPNSAMAAFTATTTDADTYSWDFGDGSEPSTVQNPTHTYTLSDSEQTVEVTLTIHREFCISSHPETIVLPAAALEPLEIGIDSPEGTTEFCSYDENSYALVLSPADPEGKVISSGGGLDLVDGTYFFVPDTADTNVGPVELTYVIGSRSASLTVNLLSPQADFIAGEPQEQGAGTYQVAFTNTSTSADTYAWTFGDGQTSSETNPVMTFSGVSAGQEISITLTASFADQCPDTSTGVIKIPVPTELSISLEKNRFCKREDKDYAISIDPIDPGGSVTGDGVEPQGSNFVFNPSKTSATVGPVTLTYSIADSSAETTIQLLNPTADFSFTEPRKDSTGVYEVQFTNTSSNANTYAWNFSDGQTSAVDSPQITFTDVVPGQVLQVTLTASVNNECDHSRQSAVTIPLDLAIALEDIPSFVVLCKSSDGPYPIYVEPKDPAGVVSGPGVKPVSDGFVFIPSDDTVAVGPNVLTYRIGFRSTSMTVNVADPQAGFTADFKRPDQSTFIVRFINTSTGASDYRWTILPPGMVTPITSSEFEPEITLPDAKPGNLLDVRLEASSNGYCPNPFAEKLNLPDIAPEIPPPSTELDVLRMVDRYLARLQKMPGDPLFEVTFKSTSDRVFAGTLEFLSALKNDLADPAVLPEYQNGDRNDELGERFDSLFQGCMNMIESFQGAPAPEQRQYVYIVFQMLTELLASLTAFQTKDLGAGSVLLSVLNNTIEMISLLLEFRVRLDPDGTLSPTLEEAMTVAQDQPNVLNALKTILELIR